MMADARLAATSLAQLLFLTLIGAFATIAVWLGLLFLISIALLKAGLGLTSIGALITLLHCVLLVAVAMNIGSCTEGLSFTASRKILASITKNTDNAETKVDS